MANSDPTRGVLSNESPEASSPFIPDFLVRLKDRIKSEFRFDLDAYREGTLERRLKTLLGESSMRQRVSSEGLDNLLEDTDWLASVYNELLVGVTWFQRDPEEFQALRSQLATRFLQLDKSAEFRAWCVGCATGEEAYSLAFLLCQLAGQTGFHGKITLYATDMNRSALAFASSAVYGIDYLKEFTDEQIEEFFIPISDKSFKVKEVYRKMVFFAAHNALGDAPFPRLDLISCRNLLIYLKKESQEKVLKRLNYGLKLQGLLFLAPSEDVSLLSNNFAALDEKARIYRKTVHVKDLPGWNSLTDSSNRKAASEHYRNQRETRIDSHLLSDYDQLLSIYMPCGVVTDAEGTILHLFGEANKYLKAVEGRPDNRLANRIKGKLSVAVSSLLQRARSGTKDARFPAIVLDEESSSAKHVEVGVRILQHPQTGAEHYFFSLDAMGFPATTPESGSGDMPMDEGVKTDEVVDLQNELSIVRNSLEATIEELQTTNEELNATNEELQASNEELQASNEELQSVNEELYTVNSEYATKNEELVQLNTEHRSLLESLSVGVLFLDSRMVVQKFNHAVTRLVRLLPHDVGRPIQHLHLEFMEEDSLLKELRGVLETRRPQSREVSSPDGFHFLLQIFPVLSEQGLCEGLTLTFTDVTQLKRAETLVARSEERLHQALENSRQGLWEFYLPSRQAYYSDSWYSLLGIKEVPENPTVGAWEGVLEPASRENWNRFFERAIRTDDLFSIECPVQYPENSEFWVQFRGKVRSRDESGNAVRVLGVITDITETKRLERGLRETERRLEISLQSAEQVWWDWDISRKLLSIHAADQCILGYECEDVEFSEDYWWRQIPEEELGPVRASLDDCLAGVTKAWRCEHRFRDRAGDYRWVIETGKIMERGADGKPVRMLGITQLNHQRKLDQIELQESREFYRAVVEDQTELICRLDSDYRIRFVNKAFLDEFSFSSAEGILGREWQEVMGAKDPEFIQLLSSLEANENPKTHHHCFGSGELQFWIQWSCRKLGNEDGSFGGFQCVGRDLTQLKKVENQLRESLKGAETARELAEAANRAKSDFLAVMNHELRTPLNPIIAGSEILAQSVDSPQLSPLVDIIHTAGKTLLSLIDSVLNFSRLEKGSIQPNRELMNPGEIASEVLSLFLNTADAKGIQLTKGVDASLPDWIVCDPSMIRQILINLVNNAIKFTKNGSVLLELKFKKGTEWNQGTLILEVEDTGVGIPEEMRSTIFEPFTQVDSGLSRQFGGAGIGLAVCRDLVHLLGGWIELDSVLKKGSRFRIHLPVTVGPAPGDAPEAEFGMASLEKLKELQILVAEDDPANRIIIEQILKSAGCGVCAVADGNQAIEAYKAQPVPCLILDIHMPGRDGIETAQAILADLPDGDRPPHFLFLSADNRGVNRQKAVEIPNSRFVAKPVQPKKLLEVLQQLFV